MLRIFLLSYCVVIVAECCSESLCSSIVSKCLLTKACSCNLQTRVCAKDCFICLGQLYTQCCSCVDLCPRENETLHHVSKQSHVDDFIEAIPELFNVLTEHPDELDRWSVVKYPLKVDVKQYTIKKNEQVTDESKKQQGVLNKEFMLTINCTVAFWSQCMSWTKCKNSCLTMGASSYRWFHDGCCECIGRNCFNYGIKENRCYLCPLTGDVIEEEEDEYGEEDDDYY